MPHVIVRLEDQDFRRLGAMAARQTREVDQQATFIVRRAISREMMAAPATADTPSDRPL